jgi:hypothetical protein
MTLNYATEEGGAVNAIENSVITVTNCTISLNLAYSGGAVETQERASVFATDCTMTSNTAARGGAIDAVEQSTVVAKRCTISFNFATTQGGAVNLDSNVGLDLVLIANRLVLIHTGLVLIDSRLVHNVALSGGALAVASGQSDVLASHFSNNYATEIGGAVLVLSNGTISLMNSSFGSNFDGANTTSGVGIDNLGGEIQCGGTQTCLSVCTLCLDDGVPPSPAPSSTPSLSQQSPTSHPVAITPPRNKNEDDVVRVRVLVVFAVLVLFVVLVGGLAGGIWWRRRPNATSSATLSSDIREQLMSPDDRVQATRTTESCGFHDPGSISLSGLPGAPFVENPSDSHVWFAMLRSSRAAVVVVDHSMRIKLWSKGENGL